MMRWLNQSFVFWIAVWLAVGLICLCQLPFEAGRWAWRRRHWLLLLVQPLAVAALTAMTMLFLWIAVDIAGRYLLKVY